MKIASVIGARPNFMKAAPAIAALASCRVAQVVIHTGQHYDANMSDLFLNQLGMPPPDYNLEVGSASHAVQTAGIMVKLEPILQEQRPDWVLVYGDVNSTVAAALVAAKLGLRLAHVEAGLRSFDRSMPEEINRIVTDALADRLYTPSRDGDDNLIREGVAADKICLVGNLMIDSLVRMLPLAAPPTGLDTTRPYILVTLHRPTNVDDPCRLQQLMTVLASLAAKWPVVFPVHPRTKQRLVNLPAPNPKVALHLLEPVGYLEFLALQAKAGLIITDSGGIQEESTFLRVPCLTVRANTERPITVGQGTNELIGENPQAILEPAEKALSGCWKTGRIPPLWDGRAGERLADDLIRHESCSR